MWLLDSCHKQETLRTKVSNYDLQWGERSLTGENLDVVWAKFSTLIWAVLLIIRILQSIQMVTSKIENSAQVLSC